MTVRFVEPGEQTTTTPPVEAAPIEQTQPAEQPVVEQPPAAEAAPVEPVMTPAEPALLPGPPRQYKYADLEEDEGFSKLADAYKTNELRNYLNISTADYDKLSDKELLRMKYERQYAGLSPEERAEMVEHAITTQYNLTGDTDQDKFSLLLMKNDANIERNALKEQQANYKLPEYTAPQQQEVDPAQQQAVAQYNAMLEGLKTNADLLRFGSERTLKLGNGDDAYTYQMPQGIDPVSILTNPDTLYSKLIKVGPTGTPEVDTATLLRWNAFLADPEKYDSLLINHGKSLKEKQSFEESRNIPPEGGDNGTPAPKSRFRFVDNNGRL